MEEERPMQSVKTIMMVGRGSRVERTSNRKEDKT
jgi:hypothetical protein